MLSSAVPHSTDQGQGATSSSMLPFPTAGQRSAADDLRAALEARQPTILVFGESGSGKTTLINSVLDAANAAQFVALNLSATHGEFLGPPTFDSILEAICRRLGTPRPTKERPETVALLSDCLNTLTDKGQSLVLGIDHADNLSDEVIGELAQLEKYLDRAPSNIVRVFVGSLTLATRIDSAMRCLGIKQRFSEIRLTPPSAEEVAALLAYEDGCQHGGPMLTAGAIDRICAYAKSNLHWAVPMADAARILAESEGKHEVSAELVRSALHEIWSPEQNVSDDTHFLSEQGDVHTGAHPVTALGLSDSISPYLDIHVTTETHSPEAARHRSTPSFRLILFTAFLAVTATAFFWGDTLLRQRPQEPEFVIRESLGPESLPDAVLRELTQDANDANVSTLQQEQPEEPRSAESQADSLAHERSTNDEVLSNKRVPLSSSPKRRPDSLKNDHWIQTR